MAAPPHLVVSHLAHTPSRPAWSHLVALLAQLSEKENHGPKLEQRMLLGPGGAATKVGTWKGGTIWRREREMVMSIASLIQVFLHGNLSKSQC